MSNFYIREIDSVLHELLYLLKNLLQYLKYTKEKKVKNNSKQTKKKKKTKKVKEDIKEQKPAIKKEDNKEKNEVLVVGSRKLNYNAFEGDWTVFRPVTSISFIPNLDVPDVTGNNRQNDAVGNLYKALTINGNPNSIIFSGDNATRMGYKTKLIPRYPPPRLDVQRLVTLFNGNTHYEVLMKKLSVYCSRTLFGNTRVLMIQNCFNRAFNMGNCTVMTFLTPFLQDMDYYHSLIFEEVALVTRRDTMINWIRQFLLTDRFKNTPQFTKDNYFNQAVALIKGKYAQNEDIYLSSYVAMVNYLGLGKLGLPLPMNYIVSFVNYMYKALRIFGDVCALLETLALCCETQQPPEFTQRYQYLISKVKYYWRGNQASLPEVFRGLKRIHEARRDEVLGFLDAIIQSGSVVFEQLPGDYFGHYKAGNNLAFYNASGLVNSKVYYSLDNHFLGLNEMRNYCVLNTPWAGDNREDWTTVVLTWYFLMGTTPIICIGDGRGWYSDPPVIFDNTTRNKCYLGFSFVLNYLYSGYFAGNINGWKYLIANYPMFMIKTGDGHIEVDL